MVLSKAKTVEKYKRAIDLLGGYDAYAKCGAEKDKGFLAVAKCMRGLKIKIGTAGMVAKYEAAA